MDTNEMLVPTDAEYDGWDMSFYKTCFLDVVTNKTESETGIKELGTQVNASEFDLQQSIFDLGQAPELDEIILTSRHDDNPEFQNILTSLYDAEREFFGEAPRSKSIDPSKNINPVRGDLAEDVVINPGHLPNDDDVKPGDLCKEGENLDDHSYDEEYPIDLTVNKNLVDVYKEDVNWTHQQTGLTVHIEDAQTRRIQSPCPEDDDNEDWDLEIYRFSFSLSRIPPMATETKDDPTDEAPADDNDAIVDDSDPLGFTVDPETLELPVLNKVCDTVTSDHDDDPVSQKHQQNDMTPAAPMPCAEDPKDGESHEEIHDQLQSRPQKRMKLGKSETIYDLSQGKVKAPGSGDLEDTVKPRRSNRKRIPAKRCPFPNCGC